MPLAIKSSGQDGIPTHSSGDLLVAFQIGSNAASAAGWTDIASAATTWSRDSYRVSYRIADSSSVAWPFPGYSGRGYSITGAKTSDPIAAYGTYQFGAWSNTIVCTAPSISVPGATESSSGSAYFVNGAYQGYGLEYPSITSATSSGFTMGTGDFTIECWYKAKSFNGNNYLFDLGTNGTVIQFYSNQIYTVNGGAYRNVGAAGLGFSTNTWYHIAWVRSSGVSKLYLNGTEISSASDTVNMTDTGCKIGTYGGGGGYNWDGYISNFRIVKGTAVYTSNFTPSGPLTAISGTSLLTCQSPSGVTDSSTNALSITKANSILANGDSPFGAMNDAIRLTLFTGYGGGGNDWGGNNSLTVGGPGIGVVSSGPNYAFIEGGTGPIHNMGGNVGVSYGGGRAIVTVSINPAPSSGFFAMF